MDCKQDHEHRLTDTLANLWTQKSKNLKKPTISVVNAGPPDTECLYYPLDVAGVSYSHQRSIKSIKFVSLAEFHHKF